MTAKAKFLFDHDFGSGGSKPTILIADHKAKLAQAEQIAYRNGFGAAQAQAATEAERSLATALAMAATAFDKLHAEVSALEARLETEAVEVALAVARKLAPELMTREPLAELSALAGDCFRHLVSAPHVAVRVGEALYQQAHEALTRIARERGFEGRLVVLADPAVGEGDCRIEWADGGVVRDRSATEAAITELIARYLGARQCGPTAPAEASDLIGRFKP